MSGPPLKVKVEIVVPEHRVEEVVKAVMEAARTGEIGEAKISMASIEEAIGIRTGEKGGKNHYRHYRLQRRSPKPVQDNPVKTRNHFSLHSYSGYVVLKSFTVYTIAQIF